MRLYELAYACRLYREVAQFDPAYKKVRTVLGEDPNLTSQAQQDSLMEFLNDWLCRIPEKNFPALKDRLQRWAGLWAPVLPNAGRDIRSLNETERAQIGKSYEALLKLGIGLHFQETAAAKTLHALRPHALPMWDAKIKDWFSAKRASKQTAAQCYSDFLSHVAEKISELEVDVNPLGYSLSDVSQLVQRPGVSLVKLVDEYYWITITCGHVVPAQNDLEQWLGWSNRGALATTAQ